jgi:uncharacterized protein (TIGR01244 family)
MRDRGLVTVRLAAAAAAFLSLGSCSAPDGKVATGAGGPVLEPYECGSVARIHTLGGVFLASQPAPEDLKHAREGGIKTVVSLRKPDEIDWDEAAVVKDLGMEFRQVPFPAPGELTDEVFDEVRALLNDAEKRPLLLHCASANRVGAVWLAHRALDHGLSLEAAGEEAKTVGLKLPAYTERAREYVEERRSGGGKAE